MEKLIKLLFQDSKGKSISEIVEGNRENVIYKLCLLGWNPYEIAKIVGIDESTVRGIVENLPKVKNQLLEDFNNKKPIEQIAEYHGLDLQTAWALVLQDRSEKELLEVILRKFNHRLSVSILKLS